MRDIAHALMNVLRMEDNPIHSLRLNVVEIPGNRILLNLRQEAPILSSQAFQWLVELYNPPFNPYPVAHIIRIRIFLTYSILKNCTENTRLKERYATSLENEIINKDRMGRGYLLTLFELYGILTIDQYPKDAEGWIMIDNEPISCRIPDIELFLKDLQFLRSQNRREVKPIDSCLPSDLLKIIDNYSEREGPFTLFHQRQLIPHQQRNLEEKKPKDSLSRQPELKVEL
ncbi:COXBURSA331_A1300 family Dot/Icm T4SS effector [Coxiella burnetii]|uniref:COXBURSA331_A1300 family Dot/Icm T4SS effector n=1 Tax=Coxiella burnetii TaxID=777 RepID=UPI000183CF31|nr:COXBURSA331_A1300 family Dot/Icm T4SS effector [Coxiella burnetii]ACJ18241.1 hypothetical protein CbuG_0859 [Coxiella burnetii CbuG_Q212]ATN66627.1 hypothetical protein AYM17_04105 [Coxiella burnetii]OYK86385.1 hypothetical protein CbuQ229_04310 [Coxiella burnetii]